MDDDDWCDDEATVGLVQRAVSRKRGRVLVRQFSENFVHLRPYRALVEAPACREAASTLGAMWTDVRWQSREKLNIKPDFKEYF